MSVKSSIEYVSCVQNYYGQRFLLTNYGKILVLCLAVAYYTLSVWGILRLDIGYRVASFFLPSFMGFRYYDLMEQYMWEQGWRMEIIVRNPGNLSDPYQRWVMLQMQNDFDNTICSMPMGGKLFWLTHFIDHVGAHTREIDEFKTWSKTLSEWSTMASFEYTYSQDLAWRNLTPEEHTACNCNKALKSYRFPVSLKDYGRPTAQSRCQHVMRGLTRSERYKPYDVFTVSTEASFSDMHDQIVPMTLQNISIATFCMIILAAIFLQDFVCLVYIVLCILSIDLGVIGFMGWWHIRLDVISMITILMSIGLSVDYSAHITYAYVHCKEEKSEDKILIALGEVGLPVLHGAVSTFVGVLPLAFTGSYTGNSFTKVVTLVIWIGMMHGCVFLPILFSITDPTVKALKRKFGRVVPKLSDKNCTRGSAGSPPTDGSVLRGQTRDIA